MRAFHLSQLELMLPAVEKGSWNSEKTTADASRNKDEKKWPNIKLSWSKENKQKVLGSCKKTLASRTSSLHSVCMF